MGEMVICCYRPKPGREKDLLDVVREHHATLRSEGLVTERPNLTMRAGDGSIVEIFEWKSRRAVEEAHRSTAVKRMWDRFNEVGTCIPYGRLEEAKEPYPHFEPIDR